MSNFFRMNNLKMDPKTWWHGSSFFLKTGVGVFLVLISFFVLPYLYADIKIEVVSTTSNTATGDQDITSAGFGSTPKAALIFMTNGTTDNTAATHLVFAVGATDGTREIATSTSSEDADPSGSSDTLRWAANDKCVLMVGIANDIDGEGDCSFISDGVRINWSNAPAAAYKMSVTLFGGSNLTAYVNTFTSSASLGGTADVTAPGFEPDQVVVFSHRTLWNDLASDAGSISVGFADNGVSVTQGSVNYVALHNTTTTSTAMVASDSYAGFSLRHTDLDDAIELGSFDADGFTATTSNEAGSHIWGYLALNYGGAAEHWVGFYDTPTSTGNSSVTGVGFQPQFVMSLTNMMVAYDTFVNSGEAVSFGVGLMTPDVDHSFSVSDLDAAADSDTVSRFSTSAVSLLLDDHSGDAHIGELVSMDADGWTTNFTTTDGTARKWIGLAVSESTATARTSDFFQFFQ